MSLGGGDWSKVLHDTSHSEVRREGGSHSGHNVVVSVLLLVEMGEGLESEVLG